MATPDEDKSVEALEQMGARIRRRKSGRIHTIDFRPCASQPDDSKLALLEGLHSLVELYLESAPITDACLGGLACHQQLATLDLQQTAVGDHVFQLAEQLPALKVLVLSGTAVTLEEVRKQRSRLIQTRIVYLA
jgi:hypothetical protein